MRICGFQKFSLLDYPGKISAIVFTGGCNFRCPYCHNPELVRPKSFKTAISEKSFFKFLKSRQGQLDAVVITGGEPTLQKDLLDFIKQIKKLNFLVKLDTNGSYPEVLKKILEANLVDYFAMDIKSPLEKYKNIVGNAGDVEKIIKSIKLIKEQNKNYEFRTTIVKPLLSMQDVIKISQEIKGAKKYVLQKFIASKTLDPEYLGATTYSDAEFKKMQKEVKRYVKMCEIRPPRNRLRGIRAAFL